MRKLFRLYGYELKNAYGYMLKSMLIVITVIAVCAALLYGYVNGISADREDSRMTLAVVFNDESDAIFPALVGFANEISSLKGFCRLEIFDEKTAFRKLEKGDVKMVMVVPEGFMDAAEHLKEAEVTLYSKGELSTFEYKILGLFHGVEGIMLNTEGGIMAMYRGMEEYSFTCSRSEMENAMMELFIMNFMGRDSYFKNENVSAYGDYSIIEHYIVAVLLLLVTFSGVIYLKTYSRQQKRVEIIMSSGTGFKVLTAVMKILCIAMPLITEMWLMLIVARIVIDRLEIVGAYIEGQAFVVAVLIGISIASIVHLTANIFDRQAQRVTAYVLFVIILSLVSGVISSAYYLPTFLRKIVIIWPMHGWHQMLLGTIFGSVRRGNVINIVVESLCLAVVGTAIYVRSLARHE